MSYVKTLFSGSLFILTLLLVAWIILFFDVKNKSAQIIEGQAKIAEFDIFKQHKLEMRNFLRDTENQRLIMDTYFLRNNVETAAFFDELKNLSESFGVTFMLREAKFENEEDGKNTPSSLLLSIEVDGPFRNLYNFLRVIEVYPLKIAVTRADFSPRLDKTADDENMWRARYDVRIFSAFDK